MTSIAVVVTDRCSKKLTNYLKLLNINLDIQIWPNITRPDDVEFAVLWKQPKGILSQFNNLKAVTSLGAGIDFITSDPNLPLGMSVHRIVTPFLKQQMAQYVLAYILSDYRQLSTYKAQQGLKQWQGNEIKSKTIGFLGLGAIGKFVANQCKTLGFNTIAYTYKSDNDDINCFHQEQGLKHVMQVSDYIICLLPLTKDTSGLLNKKRFNYCKNKPIVIHVGRGEQLIEKDLICALNKGLIKHAILDVFATEPLPKESILWQRSDITITPHNSARSDDKQTANAIHKWLNLLA